jgi:MFS superfamily sulfate permease-like transporter
MILKADIMLPFLDIMFDILHILLVIFIVTGWLFPNLQKIHLVVVLLTGCSWIIFGNELNNCILTEWHFNILRKMGIINLPDTYTQYALKRITGLAIPKTTALLITRLCWLLSLLLSITWLRIDSLSRKKEKVKTDSDFRMNRSINWK